MNCPEATVIPETGETIHVRAQHSLHVAHSGLRLSDIAILCCKLLATVCTTLHVEE